MHFRLKQQELEDQHSEVEYELRRLMAKPGMYCLMPEKTHSNLLGLELIQAVV